ncbi:hypothetical protein PMAYCL1PPCAC_09126 [Pristionchus mayeri]|uniref:G protein-coupled receptor n=1 Tax=Pristionchus mayeri TaxID=1317129 RepID=A0AAN5CEL7_9BILA|nr:hypothetical protein PMAYCL1PPCAC_09126 [Pristionchus mayeri]
MFMYFRRRKVVMELAKILSTLSPKSRLLQEGLIKSITVHAILATSGIWPCLIFLSGQFVIVHEVNFLDSCFFVNVFTHSMVLQLQSAIHW